MDESRIKYFYTNGGGKCECEDLCCDAIYSMLCIQRMDCKNRAAFPLVPVKLVLRTHIRRLVFNKYIHVLYDFENDCVYYVYINI